MLRCVSTNNSSNGELIKLPALLASLLACLLSQEKHFFQVSWMTLPNSSKGPLESRPADYASMEQLEVVDRLLVAGELVVSTADVLGQACTLQTRLFTAPRCLCLQSRSDNFCRRWRQ